MTTDQIETCDRDHRLGAVLAACLEEMDDGQTPDRADLLARYPEFAEELVQFLDDQERVERCARPLRAALGNAAGTEFAEHSQLGDFRIVGEVGRGGMGVVYEAEQVSLGRRVALKVLPLAVALDPRALQRFQNEARAAACLHHTHVVPVYFVGCERGVHFYAMQFIEGQTLADLIGELRRSAGQEPAPTPDERTTAHTPADDAAAKADTEPARQSTLTTQNAARGREFFRRAAEWGVQAAEALDHAHQAAVVHRDVKPGNLLLDGGGKLWVADFGLAHVRQGEAGLTMTGEMLGTLRYMSPEQALAKRTPIDHRTDVYSLGATLYELLTLRPAFDGKDRQELLRQIAFDEPKSLRRLDRKIPAELEIIVLKAMEKNPGDRYATAQEMADDLRRFLDDKPVRAKRPSWAWAAVKWARRHKPLVGAAATVLPLVMLLVGGAALVARDKAMRRAETARVVGLALDESASWQQKKRLPEALSAARRAAGLVAGGEADDALRERVRARAADLKLLADLDNTRLEFRALFHERGRFDYEKADNLYAAAFHEHGLDVEALPPEEAGERLRRTTVAAEAAAMLDHWVIIRRGLKRPADNSWKEFLQIARAADPDVWRNAMREALERGDKSALAKLTQSEEVFGLLPPTLEVVTNTLRAGGDPELAEALMAAAQARNPDDFWLNYLLGNALRDSNKPDEAVGFIRAALAARPSEGVVHLDLGHALADKGQLEEAIREYRRAVEFNLDSATAHNNLGMALADKGQSDEAIREYRRAVELNAKLPQPHNNLGAALRDKGRLDEAIGEFRRAIELDPELALPHANLGRLLLQDKKQLDEAIRECRRAIELDAKVAGPHNDLGDALQDKGQLDEAIREFRRAIEIDPKNAAVHNNLGNALRGKGQPDEAIRECRRAIELDPKLALAHSNLGVALGAKGQLDEAIRELERAIELDPKLALAHSNLGVALGAKGRPDEAIAEFRRTIELDPKLIQARNNLGAALVSKGQPDEAIREFRRAVELNPDSASAHNNLAIVLHGTHQPEEAVRELRRAIELDPKDAPAHYSLGFFLREMGKFTESLDEFRKGRRLGSVQAGRADPSDQWLREAEQLVALDRKLPAVLAGKEKPANNVERVALAIFCQQPFKKCYAASARFYEEAFTRDPKLADNLDAGYRYNAACAAALAGCGQGKDTKELDDQARARLRRQALEWLRADVEAWRALGQKLPAANRPAIAQQLQHWLEDSDLAGVRGEKALLALPEAERPDWQKLWQEVEALRRPAASPPDKATPSPPKQTPSVENGGR